MPERDDGLGRAGRIVLILRVLTTYGRIRLELARSPLPEVVRRIGGRAPRGGVVQPPHRVRRAVERTLWPVGGSPRCIFTALTLFSLLHDDGRQPHLVIGLLDPSPDHTAHAWVELDGHDLGLHGGRGRHHPIARYS